MLNLSEMDIISPWASCLELLCSGVCVCDIVCMKVCECGQPQLPSPDTYPFSILFFPPFVPRSLTAIWSSPPHEAGRLASPRVMPASSSLVLRLQVYTTTSEFLTKVLRIKHRSLYLQAKHHTDQAVSPAQKFYSLKPTWIPGHSYTCSFLNLVLT